MMDRIPIYCIVNENRGKYYVGELVKIVRQAFKWEYDSTGTLIVKHEWYKDRKFHSYDMTQWTPEERERDVVEFIAGRLENWGYKLFKEKL